ncbi:MAG: sigma-54 dependent transcriptional regulator [Nitrospirota bacterium]|jgi:DNA-binding NtrC family response regulator
MKKSRVLVIEDEKIMRVTLSDALSSMGYEVVAVEDGGSGLREVAGEFFDVVVTDVRLPDTSGLEILKTVKDRNGDDTCVIVMTAYGTIKDAVEAMKHGAFDYITKPFSLDEFMIIMERALEMRRLRQDNLRLRKDLNRCYSFPNIIGESAGMKKVFSLIGKVAASDATVLITGETGTGKELVATTIHYQSERKDKPLIKVNCAALPGGLIESELFGHEKGAFTGAARRKPGRFELADGGTIFLDEIGDLPPETQAKLLRVMQERSFERLGGESTIAVDVRVVAATNKDLAKEVEAGRFREDLYYRFNVIPIHIPPLRERKEDLLPLITCFSRKISGRLSKEVKCSRDAIEVLLGYDFPGNVRELENIMERSATLSATGVIKRSDLPSYVCGELKTPGTPSLSDVTSLAEKDHVLRVLAMTGGNRTRAAEMLGISRKTLWEKLKTYGIEQS